MHVFLNWTKLWYACGLCPCLCSMASFTVVQTNHQCSICNVIAKVPYNYKNYLKWTKVGKYACLKNIPFLGGGGIIVYYIRIFSFFLSLRPNKYVIKQIVVTNYVLPDFIGIIINCYTYETEITRYNQGRG